MVNQANEVNGNRLRGRSMTTSAKELLHDCISLGELQARLLLLDLREGGRGMIGPTITIVVAASVLLGTVPIALAAIAAGLWALSVPLWVSFLISATLGVAGSGIAGYLGWRKLKREMAVIERSKTEFQRNVAWLKATLKHH